MSAIPSYTDLTRDISRNLTPLRTHNADVMQGFGAPLVELAQADGSRIADGSDRWGSYYEKDPRVLAGYLPASRRVPGFSLGAHAR